MATTNAALAREVKALKTELAELKKLHEESGGGKTLDQILKVAKKDMSKDKYEALIERYVAGYSTGKGFKGIVVSTWNKGWQGESFRYSKPPIYFAHDAESSIICSFVASLEKRRHAD